AGIQIPRLFAGGPAERRTAVPRGHCPADVSRGRACHGREGDRSHRRLQAARREERMSALPFSVSVVVPIYNEVELTEPSLRTIHAFMKQHVEDFEIVVVESGSTDATGAICDRVAAELSNTRVFHEGQRNGMGAALRLGYENSTKSYVWLVTVDLPFPLE